MKFSSLLLLPALAATAGAATVTYNDTITAIYGTGNTDQGWVSAVDNNIQLGLRAKIRATSATPNDGAGTYTVPTGFDGTKAVWNFDFSLNSNANGQALNSLASYRFVLSYDTDPSPGVTWTNLDLSTIPDNSFGTASTANGAGIEGTWVSLAGSNTIAQNSENSVFFPAFPSPNTDATYDFKLTAYSSTDTDSRAPLDSVSMRVVVGAGGSSVPDSGSTFALLGSALLGMAGLNKVRSRRAAK